MVGTQSAKDKRSRVLDYDAAVSSSPAGRQAISIVTVRFHPPLAAGSSKQSGQRVRDPRMSFQRERGTTCPWEGNYPPRV